MADQVPVKAMITGGFEFDRHNEFKLAAHGIRPADIWEILASEPRWFAETRQGRSATHWMIGPLASGRFLRIVVVLVDPTQ